MPVANRYFAGARASTTVEPFTHSAHDIYLVTRLDGFTLQDALALIVVAREDTTLLGGASMANYYPLGTYRRVDDMRQASPELSAAAPLIPRS